jgi:hypothetical protein
MPTAAPVSGTNVPRAYKLIEPGSRAHLAAAQNEEVQLFILREQGPHNDPIAGRHGRHMPARKLEDCLGLRPIVPVIGRASAGNFFSVLATAEVVDFDGSVGQGD